MEKSSRRRTCSATASGSNSEVVTESSGPAGRIGSASGPSRSFGRLQDGGHWGGESNGRQHGGRGNGSSRMSSGTPSNFQHNIPRGTPRARFKVCLTCRCRKIECDGVRPRCGPCQRNPEDSP
ncbi:hypothetical protein L218DRAFT_69297 [Marasmius fiardii PR-910]|nr:hypothetical protein L218DRAFT_69297 [Marasmius fiardii PR-910]